MPMLPTDGFMPSDSVWRKQTPEARRSRKQYLTQRIASLTATRLPLWTGDDLAFFHHYRDDFRLAAQEQWARDMESGASSWMHPQAAPQALPPDGLGAHLDVFGRDVSDPTAMQSRVTVVPKFGLLWVGIAALVTVGVTAVWHGARHEREARAVTRNR
ncbi:hypothetical protein CMI47_00845 [Candidatus Pacearchaeota archaeon]|nr:hypothetical protein [Candidatus Pacearchaeota archaeon]